MTVKIERLKEQFVLTCGDNNNNERIKIMLNSDELKSLDKAIEMVYYAEDVKNYFCVDNPNYDTSLEQHKYLLEKMTKYYAERREEHDSGGEYDSVAHWTVAMRETEEAFEDELERYHV